MLSESILFMFAAGVLDTRTLLPAFVGAYSSSLVLIALLPAIRSGGWLLPQLFAAHIMRSHVRKKTWLLAAGAICRLPVAATPLLLLLDPRAPATLVLAVFFASLVIFAVADSFAGIAWYDIVGKAVPSADRPWLFGGMMVGGSLMGLAAGVLITALLDNPRWPFPDSYIMLFALAFAALAFGYAFLFGLVEPAGEPPPATAGWHATMSRLRGLLGTGGPFARLMQVQLLLGAPALAAGLYMPYALDELRLPLDATGIFVAATAVGAALGGLAFPLTARRWGSRVILTLTSVPVVLAPLAAAAAGLLPRDVWVGEACGAFSFACQGLATTGLFIGVSDLVLAMAPPGELPLFIGLCNTVAGLLVPLPLLGGLLAQWFGPAAVLWLCPLPALAGVVVLRGVQAPGAPAATELAAVAEGSPSGHRGT
jgi:MFS family permease